MAFDDKDQKTRLQRMLSNQQKGGPGAGEVGKQSRADQSSNSNQSAASDQSSEQTHDMNHVAGQDQAAAGNDQANNNQSANNEQSKEQGHEGEHAANGQQGPSKPAGAPSAAKSNNEATTEANAAESSSEGGFGRPAAMATKKDGGDGTAKTPPAGAAPTPGKPKKGASAGKITLSLDEGGRGNTSSPAQVAVGEKLTATAEEEGTWRLDQNSLSPGKETKFTAPETEVIRNLVFEPYLDSPNRDTQASMPIFTVAPKTVDFKKIGDVPATGPGTAGVGMTLQVTIGPNNVGFGQAEWLEKPGPAQGVTGYFAAYVASGQSLAHIPNKSGIDIGNDNQGVIDNAWTKDKPKLKHPTDGTMRWWAGSFSWTIPNIYRIKGSAGEHQITNITQTFTMDDSGAITVTKGGASATAKPDNDMAGDIQKFATVKDAHTFLSAHGRAGCVQAAMNYKRNSKADEASIKNLVTALRNIDVLFYVGVTCNKVFSWTDSEDTVSVKANGQPAIEPRKKMGKGETQKFEFNVNKIMDVNSLAIVPINISSNSETFATNEAGGATVGYPYSGAGSLNENYTYNAFFR